MGGILVKTMKRIFVAILGREAKRMQENNY